MVFLNKKCKIQILTYFVLREISGSFKVKPGNYVIIPTTFEPDCDDCEFMLRILTEHDALNDQKGNTVVYSSTFLFFKHIM